MPRCYINIMTNVRPCDLIVGCEMHPNDTLLVVEVMPNSLHAGKVIDATQENQIVATPGTYWIDQLCGISVIETWKAERAAAALTKFFFEHDSEQYSRMYSKWLLALEVRWSVLH